MVISLQATQLQVTAPNWPELANEQTAHNTTKSPPILLCLFNSPLFDQNCERDPRKEGCRKLAVMSSGKNSKEKKCYYQNLYFFFILY